MNARPRKRNSNFDSKPFLDNVMKKLEERNEHKNKMRMSTEYIDKLFRALKKHGNVGTYLLDCIEKYNKEEIGVFENLNLFFEVIEEYAKKYMVKSDSSFNKVADLIYYIIYDGVTARISAYSGQGSTEIFLEICEANTECICFFDIMNDMPSQSCKARMKEKESFENAFKAFWSFLQNEGFTEKNIQGYMEDLISRGSS